MGHTHHGVAVTFLFLWMPEIRTPQDRKGIGKLMFVAPIRTAPKASLVQREVSAEQADGGIDAVKCIVFAFGFGEIVTSDCTTPQSEIYDF